MRPERTTFTAIRDATRQDYPIIARHSVGSCLGLPDRNMHDRFRDHPWWRDCAEFCEKYDQNSFDPDYETPPLEAFETALRKLFSAPRRSIYLPESEPGATSSEPAPAPASR